MQGAGSAVTDARDLLAWLDQQEQQQQQQQGGGVVAAKGEEAWTAGELQQLESALDRAALADKAFARSAPEPAPTKEGSDEEDGAQAPPLTDLNQLRSVPAAESLARARDWCDEARCLARKGDWQAALQRLGVAALQVGPMCVFASDAPRKVPAAEHKVRPTVSDAGDAQLEAVAKQRALHPDTADGATAAELREATELYGEIHSEMARAHLELGDAAAAWKAADKALLATPKDATARYRRGLAALRRRDLDAARADLTEVDTAGARRALEEVALVQRELDKEQAARLRPLFSPEGARAEGAACTTP